MVRHWSVILKLDPEEASRRKGKSDIIQLQRRIRRADDLARTGNSLIYLDGTQGPRSHIRRKVHLCHKWRNPYPVKRHTRPQEQAVPK